MQYDSESCESNLLASVLYQRNFTARFTGNTSRLLREIANSLETNVCERKMV